MGELKQGDLTSSTGIGFKNCNLILFIGFKDSVTCVGFSPDGGMVATADLSGMIKVWNTQSKKEIWSFECSDTEVSVTIFQLYHDDQF
jgi:WD40 repeat protein